MQRNLDQLRTRGEIYRRGLYTLGNRDNAPPEQTQSLPGSSRESSTEPMDTDDAQWASAEIYGRIRHQAGLSRSGSAGDVTLWPEHLGIMTQGLILCWETSEQPQGVPSGDRDQPVRNTEQTRGAVGGHLTKHTPMFHD